MIQCWFEGVTCGRSNGDTVDSIMVECGKDERAGEREMIGGTNVYQRAR